MILVLLYSMIYYRAIFNISKCQRDFAAPFVYRFKPGGKFTINIKNGGDEKILIILANESFINDYLDKQDMYKPCKVDLSNKYFHLINTQNGEGSINGTIDEEGIYNTYLKACSYFNHEFTIEIIFKNPNSCFSSDNQPSLNKLQFNIYLTVALLIIWVLNSFCHSSVLFSSYNNILFLIFQLIFVVEQIYIYIILDLLSMSDDIPKYMSIVLLLMNMKDTFFIFFYFLKFFNDFLGKKIVLALVAFFLLFKYQLNYYRIYHYFRYQTFDEIYESWFFVFFLFMCMLLVYLPIYLIGGIIYGLYNKSYTFAICNWYLIFDLIRSFPSNSFHDNLYQIDLFFIVLIIYNICIKKSSDREICFNKFFENEVEKKPIEINLSKQKVIKKGMFGYSREKYIFIPKNIEKIEDNAFAHTKQLKIIEIAEDSKLISIGKNVFLNSSIQSINIPKSVVKLQKGWCQNIKYLKNIKISTNNPVYTYFQNFHIIEKSTNTLIFTRRDVYVASIPSNITKIGYCAFDNCNVLNKVIFQNNSKLQIIDSHAFSNSSLPFISIPCQVVEIDSYAFYMCLRLTKIKFQNGSKLVEINDYAFSYSSLKRISIPSSVLLIGKNAFSNCFKLEYVLFENRSQLTNIQKEAFFNSSIKSISIPSKVKILGDNAFGCCKKNLVIEFQFNQQLPLIDINLFEQSPNVIVFIPAKSIEKKY